IIWRANPSNPINKWYQVECDGQFKFSNWNIYWIGLDVSLVPEVCKYLNDLDVDFYE
ncbi:MAG: acetylglutamate kinase, partial [Leptospiraceae bacterium]|nr:acetylglutamate kinase [Leptospiraceae bacterium]